MKKKCFILDISRFLCFREIHRFQNLWCHHKHCYIMEVTYACFFWILSPNKTKLGQTLMYCPTNISNLFLAQCWRLETSSRPFYDFIKMTIGQDLAIFDSWHLPVLIVPYSPKNETLESWHNWLLSNFSRLPNWKEPGTLPQSSKSLKRFLKIIIISINWSSLVT